MSRVRDFGRNAAVYFGLAEPSDDDDRDDDEPWFVHALGFSYLIVFVRDGEVTRAFRHEVGGGNLTCLTYPALRRGGLSPGRDQLQARRVRLSASDAYDLVFLAQSRAGRETQRIERCLHLYSGESVTLPSSWQKGTGDGATATAGSVCTMRA